MNWPAGLNKIAAFEGRNLSCIVTVLVTTFLTIVLLVAWFALERIESWARRHLQVKPLFEYSNLIKKGAGYFFPKKNVSGPFFLADKKKPGQKWPGNDFSETFRAE